MRTAKSIAPTAARILLGAAFLVFGLNFFLHFLPMPPHQPAADAFLGALVQSGYLLALVKGVEVVTGLLLLAELFVPLALTVLAPVLVNIALFHVFLDPAGLPVVVLLVGLEVYLAWTWRAAFAPLLRARSPRHDDPLGEVPRAIGAAA